MKARMLIIGLLLLPAAAVAQSGAQRDVWEPFKFFVGRWEGTGKGEPGASKTEREYKFVLNGKFLHTQNRSVYEPQLKNPKGEVHEDMGLFSYDKSAKQFVFRQFHGEGFVNHYVQSNLSSDGKTIVFTAERIENIPSGWRARETYKIVSPNEFTEVFELAEPGKEFQIYSEGRYVRRR